MTALLPIIGAVVAIGLLTELAVALIMVALSR